MVRRVSGISGMTLEIAQSASKSAGKSIYIYRRRRAIKFQSFEDVLSWLENTIKKKTKQNKMVKALEHL